MGPSVAELDRKISSRPYYSSSRWTSYTVRVLTYTYVSKVCYTVVVIEGVLVGKIAGVATNRRYVRTGIVQSAVMRRGESSPGARAYIYIDRPRDARATAQETTVILLHHAAGCTTALQLLVGLPTNIPTAICNEGQLMLHSVDEQASFTPWM